MSLLTNISLCLNLTHLNVKSKISVGLTLLLNKQVFFFLFNYSQIVYNQLGSIIALKQMHLHIYFLISTN